MRLASLLGAAVALAAAVTGLSGPSDVAPTPAPLSVHSCKPQGPVEATLTQTGAGAGRVELSWTATPNRDVQSLSWELLLPDDAVLLEGARQGAVEQADGPLQGALVVDLPADSRSRRARLVVSGVFEGSGPDGSTWPEPFQVSASLHWGQPQVDAPARRVSDAEGELIVMPSAHRMGR